MPAELPMLGVGRGDNYLSIPTAGYHISTPHQAALNPGTNTIDLIAKVAMADWTPAGNSAFISKWGAGDQFLFYMAGSGALNMAWTNAGGVGQFPAATVASGIPDGTTKWVRALVTITAGTCDFYTGDDGGVWTPSGTQRTGFTTTAVIVPGTPPDLRAGETSAGGAQWGAAGAKIYRAITIIGGVTISDIDFTAQRVGSVNTTFVANTGETWTIANSAVIV